MSFKRVVGALVVLVLALGLAACGRPSGGGAGGQTPSKLVIGFVPSSDAEHISDKVQPMKDYLSQKLGIPVDVFVGTDYVSVVEGMGSGQVDVGFLNPLSYVLAYNEHQVKVLLKSVRNGSVTYNAQIVVNAQSGIQSLQDLKGKKFAFGDPASTSSYLWPVHYLMKNLNLKSKEDVEKFFGATTFAGGHDKVILAVYNGDFDAGATFDDARTRVKDKYPDVEQKVLVLAKIEGIPNDTISVRKDLPADFVEKFKAAMLEFAQSEQGKQVLKDLYQIDGFAEASPEDYQPVVDVAQAMGLDVKAMITKK